MSMDPWLAQYYGTGSEDLEKTAQNEMLRKLAEEDETDLSGLSDDELQQLASEVGLPEDEGSEELDAAAEQELLQKEAAAKFEEADFLGRVMAHAYTQELEKIAGKLGPGNLRGAVGHYARSAGSAIKGKAQQIGGHFKAHTAPGSSSKVRKGMEHVKRHGAAYAAGGAGVGGFAAGRASKDDGVKEAWALNKLAMMKAAEMLEAVGIDPATGQERQDPQQGQQMQQPGQQPGQQGANPQQAQQLAQQRMQQQVQLEMQRRQQQAQQQQQPGQPGMQGQQQPGQQEDLGDEQMEEAVNERALEMLQQAGYDPQALLQALQGGQQQQQPGMQR